MDRKDFIKHIAVGAVALVGGGALLPYITSPPAPSADIGYGGSAYGGETSLRSRPGARRLIS